VQEYRRTTTTTTEEVVESQKEHQVLQHPFLPVTKRSISNKERVRPPGRTPSLEEPSPAATAHLKIEIVCVHAHVTMPLTPSAYKMCVILLCQC